MLHQIWFGDSNYRQTDSGSVAAGVQFDEFGLLHADFADPQTNALVPTLDAIWTLTQRVGTPSPPSLAVKGVDIPLPEGSYYNTIEAQVMGGTEDTVVSYYVRFEHSVLSFEHWRWVSSVERIVPAANDVRPSDEAKFQPTLAALDSLAQAD